MTPFDNLDEMNRAAEQRIREALGTGTVRDPWPRKETFWRDIFISVFAGVALGVFLAWLLTGWLL